MSDGILRESLRKGVNWYRLCLFLGVVAGPTFILLWLNANYVSAPRNEEAWKLQTSINQQVSDQLAALNTDSKVNIATDGLQSKDIDRLNDQIGELRRVIYSPRQ